MNDATTQAMRDLWERSAGKAQVKIVLDRAGSAEMRESRYEVQRLDAQGTVVRRAVNLSWRAAGEIARLECAT